MANKDFFIQVLVLVIPWQIAARVLSVPRQTRLSLAEPMPNYFYNNINGHPGTYSFGYDVSDPHSGNTQFRNEERYPNGTVVGSYGYVDPNGRPHRYRYIADARGYRVMRDRPQQYNAPALASPSVNSNQGDEITWKRKKPNSAIRNMDRRTENRNFMHYPGNCLI